jgi:hypothetical protein
MRCPTAPAPRRRSAHCAAIPRYGEAARSNLEASGTNASAAVRGYLTVVAEATKQELAEILARFPPR